MRDPRSNVRYRLETRCLAVAQTVCVQTAFVLSYQLRPSRRLFSMDWLSRPRSAGPVGVSW